MRAGSGVYPEMLLFPIECETMKGRVDGRGSLLLYSEGKWIGSACRFSGCLWYHDDQEILHDVNLTIPQHGMTALVGPSGSGKSTLLNMLAGLEKPTKGEIVIAGEHIENKTENQLVRFRREHIGFIFQSFNLLSTMTALENVALPLTFQGVDKAKRLKKASALLDLVKLGKYKNHRPTQMSGGQQQRVGVARALVVDPEIIFADEPTGNLDSNTSREVMELMQQVVHEKQQTLVMVTHDNHLASFADRIFHIIDGKIVRIDDMTGKSKEEREKEEKKREEEASI